MSKLRKHKNQSSKENILCDFGYLDYIVLASTLSIALAEEFSSNDVNILANFFAILADELALIASVEVCSQSNDSDSDDEFTPPTVALTSLDSSNSKKYKKRKVKRRVKRKIYKNKSK